MMKQNSTYSSRYSRFLVLAKSRTIFILLFFLVLLFKTHCVALNRIPEWQPYPSSTLLGPLLLSVVLRMQ